MNAPDSYPVPAVRLTPLQRLWLREIGLEKSLLPVQRRTGGPQAEAEGADRPATSMEAGGASPADRPASPKPGQLVSPVQAPVAEPMRAFSAAGGQRPSSGAAGPAAAARAQAPSPGANRPSAPASAELLSPTPSDTTALAAGADFDQLREHVLACRACGLCEGRRQAVFGVGARQARWMVVGEAPGEQEDRKGEPFVGRSGQLLDAMLASVGRSRQRDVFIANVIKCRPPGNRNPRLEEIAACSPFLLRQIALIRPERILVLGRFAAQTLLRTEGSISSLRGRVHTLATPDGREVPLVVSYHPAYLLRSPLEKARAWQDLRLAASLD